MAGRSVLVTVHGCLFSLLVLCRYLNLCFLLSDGSVVTITALVALLVDACQGRLRHLGRDSFRSCIWIPIAGLADVEDLSVVCADGHVAVWILTAAESAQSVACWQYSREGPQIVSAMANRLLRQVAYIREHAVL